MPSECRREEGLFGLWRGAPANVARAALLSAGQLATYDQTKQMALAAGAAEGPALHLAASCCSGLVAQAKLSQSSKLLKAALYRNMRSSKRNTHQPRFNTKANPSSDTLANAFVTSAAG